MIERTNHLLNHALEVDEIIEQPGLVELFARQNHAHFIVVTVQVLALPVVIAQVVGRGK